MEDRFVISQLARETGYSPAMIRYFERAEVISPAIRTATRYRLFGPQHVKELGFVSAMQALGFYVQQIKALKDIGSSDRPMTEKRKEVETILHEHAQYVEEKATYFAELQTRLREAAPDFVERMLEGNV